MTKLIGLLALAQILLIALLYIKLTALEDRFEDAAPSLMPGVPNAPHAAQDRAASTGSGWQGMGTDELRRVVREELRAARLEWAAETRQEPEPAGQPIYDEAEMQSRQDRIYSDLDYFKGQDEVSQAELDLLLADIARLDPERRSEMLNELNRAMNRGEIRGNL